MARHDRSSSEGYKRALAAGTKLQERLGSKSTPRRAVYEVVGSSYNRWGSQIMRGDRQTRLGEASGDKTGLPPTPNTAQIMLYAAAVEEQKKDVEVLTIHRPSSQ